VPAIAKRAGASIIEINPEPTPSTGIISDYLIEGKAGEVLPRIIEEVEKISRRSEE
jgi:NAD-dependent deacetylase